MHTAVTGGDPQGSSLFFNSGVSMPENVLTPRRHMLAQQYYGAWLSFSAAGDRRLNTQSCTGAPWRHA